jgi:membrane fusion protein, multidrug efflux system
MARIRKPVNSEHRIMLSNEGCFSTRPQPFIIPLIPALAILLLASGCEKPTAKPAAPPTVEVITISPTNVAVFSEWIGTMDGLVNAQIRAQVTGYLQTLNYAEGSQVKKGDLLFEIDPRPFKAALDQADAKLAQDKAQREKAELDVKRYTPLAKEQAISDETAVNAVQADLAAKAQVQADEAALENARLNLGWTRVTSPVDGVAGIALGQIGDLVGPSGSLLTTVSTVDPIKVYFQVNEESYLTFWQKFVSSMDTNSQDLSLDLILSNGSAYSHKGRFYSSDRQIDTTTGTMQIVAVFPNPESTLRPGQYARVRVMTQTQSNVFVVPQRAVSQLQSTYQVAVVTDEGGGTNKAHLHPVKVGRQIGTDWIIEEGLKAGDRVVVEGTQKASDGAVVTPKPLGAPESNAGSANSSR